VVHYHGYMWTGPGAEVLVNDGKRSFGHLEFAAHGQLPYNVVDTLRKPETHVRGTWQSVDDAVTWIRAERDKLGPVLDPEQQTMAPTFDDKCAYYRVELDKGKPVVWAGWLNGGRYHDIRVVPCPAEDIRCPTERNLGPTELT
jgi:hypothetical protein